MSYPSLEYYENDTQLFPKISELLKSLPLYDFYHKLDTELSNAKLLDDACAVCNVVTPITPEGKKEQNNLCKKVCYILQFSQYIQSISESINNDKLCLYVNLWLYHHATKIPDFPERIVNLYNALNLIKTKGDNKVNQCNLTDYSISNSEFKHKQILYEFIEIYDHIKEEISREYNLNIQSYCKHIKENFRFYNEVKDKCSSTSCVNYAELQAFKNKFTVPDVLEFICEKCKFQKTLCKHGSNANDDVPCLRTKGNSFLFLIFGDDPEHIINILLNFSLISAPILALFVILFKFTPLGRSLNKLKRERKKNGRKKKEENIEDYMNNYAAHVDNVMKNRVNLGYHAT